MSGFRKLLEELTITAYDLSYCSSTGEELGSAKGLAKYIDDVTDDSVNIKETGILQHYLDVEEDEDTGIGSSTTTEKTRKLEAAATAVIIVEPPPQDHKEYPSAHSFDIRLKVTQGGKDIIDRVFDYNIQTTSVSTSNNYWWEKDPWNNRKHYFTLSPSAFVALTPSSIGLILLADGQAPNFESLVSAIDSVLTQDPDEGVA